MRLANDHVHGLLVGGGHEHRVLVTKIEKPYEVLLELGFDATDLVASLVSDHDLVAAPLQLQLVASAQLGGRFGSPQVGQRRDRGLAALLDKQPRVYRRWCWRSRALLGELAEALEVFGGDAVEWVKLHCLGIGIASLGV